MSDSLDYWPFDYTRYVEEILPALSLATEGQMTRLQQLISLGRQQHLPFCSPWDLSRGTSCGEPPSPDTFFALLEKDPNFAFGTDDFTWETVERLVSFLPGHHFGEIFELGAELHLGLIYAFCSAPIPGGIDRWQSPVGGGGDESVWRWRDYFERDEPWRVLWEQFYRPSPTVITTHISTPYDPAYPRSLNPFGEARGRVTLNGFVTPDEAHRLARELPLRRKPFLVLSSYEPVREYVMREWEKQIALSIPDYQEKKRQYYQERKQLNWPVQWRYDFKATAEVEKEEQPLKERLFGKELGSRLMYVERDFSRLGYAGQDAPEEKRFFPLKEPEREEERFFLIPEEIYYNIDTAALIPQWTQACPVEAEETHLLDWESVWQSENELMRRLDYAVSRQWGILMYYESGK